VGHTEGQDWPGNNHHCVSTVAGPMDRQLYEAKAMKQQRLELVRVGNYAVEVPVEMIVDDDEQGGWSPYFSLDDAKKLEAVRLALQEGDLATAAKFGRVFELHPISA
jgi:hypothetical protein